MGGDGDAAATVAHAVKVGDGEEIEDADAAAAMPHAGAPVEAPSVCCCGSERCVYREATRNPHMVPWGWGEGRKKYFCISLIFYEIQYFYLSTLLNSNRKTFSVNIDIN
jgi:hypothetical protein